MKQPRKVALVSLVALALGTVVAAGAPPITVEATVTGPGATATAVRPPPRCRSSTCSVPGRFQRIGALGVPRFGVVRVTLDWMQARGPGAADGQAVLTIGTGRSLRATALENRGRIVKTVALGLPSGSDGAGRGSLLFDNYS